ncbi:hypothetical protein GILI108418_07755 [Gillisia limnaea]|uniref:Uncharacterized protein n=1 Tax=Gillisia limnaea (strain DSM 15749 / LMG 21470 / R-8282) TaxID=865937 RepID=H2BXD6_GILLR|nr:hypothetical protein Gilli_1354 [Gillisia limnaea DSM 15749]
MHLFGLCLKRTFLIISQTAYRYPQDFFSTGNFEFFWQRYCPGQYSRFCNRSRNHLALKYSGSLTRRKISAFIAWKGRCSPSDSACQLNFMDLQNSPGPFDREFIEILGISYIYDLREFAPG